MTNKTILKTILCLLLLTGILTTASRAQEKPPLKFGILSIAHPARLYTAWKPFVDYVSAKMGQRFEIVIPRGFDKMKEAAARGRVDFVYVNSYVFYRLQEEGKVTPVAQMQNTAGKTTRRSPIFVRNDSGIESVAQLKGEKIAFLSPVAAGGYLAPRAYFYKHGLKTQEEAQEVFTRSLSNSVHKVLLGDAKVGAMCGLNYKLMSEKINTGELTVIGKSDDFPDDVIAARSNLPKDVVKRFVEIIITMDQDDDGRRILGDMRNLHIQKFVPYDKRIERMTESLLKEGKL